jgi:hypothetical protein
MAPELVKFRRYLYPVQVDIGVCATIEIENGANAEDVSAGGQYTSRLFSPTPRFYTLDQMLNNGHSMDEAFAGRPLSPKSSRLHRHR